MKELDRIYRLLRYELAQARNRLNDLEKELEKFPESGCSIVIKKIKGKLYCYMQWREDGAVRWKYLCPVRPGAVCREEAQIQYSKELTAQKKEQESVVRHLEDALRSLQTERTKEKIVSDYSFEVFWKDEITARVHVQGSRVKVSRFTEHPLKQLFASTSMTRHQLNHIFELRCWDRNRADIQDILNRLGINEYNPREIVQKTHGVSYNDFIWFRFSGEELTSKDVLIARDC
ncbi:MAG: hypothetical protein LUD71_06030 [Clostridiales bacterium]|nr:hypothetical protein [Clostridiales bacterium]